MKNSGEVKNKSKEKKDKKQIEIEKLQEENVALNDKIMRLSAEMQNMKRRYDEELARMLKFEGEDLIKNFLPIVDNFERAISLDDNHLNDELSKFLEGFKMIYANLISILKDHEVIEIEAMGKEFDPNTMDAVMTEHIIEEESNIVLEVMQKGYMYKSRVIRPAMVKVNE